MLAALLFCACAAPPDTAPPSPAASPPATERITRFAASDLRARPRPSDPWSILRDVPGIVLDRVDVGGSETAQQSLVLSRGDAGTGVTWHLDGADITDPAALGATSLYPDLDSMDAVEVRTSALDVRLSTPGAQVALLTRDI